MNGPAGEPSRPAGRADATGPLPVAVPADPTGPMPVSPVTPAPQAPGSADPTGPQPLLDPADIAADDPADGVAGALPGDTTGDTAEDSAGDQVEDPASSAPTEPVAETPSWFAGGESADTSATTAAPDTPTGAFPVAEDPPVGSAPAGQPADPPPGPTEAPSAHAADAPPPATSFFEAVTPPANTGVPPATGLFHTVEPHPTDAGTAPATGLFDAVPPPPADTGTAPATNLFEPAAPQPTDTGTAPATSLFESVGPAGASSPGTAGPGGSSPPILPAEATGPMAAVGAAPAGAPAGSEPGSGGQTATGASPATTAIPLVGSAAAGPAAGTRHTDAWSFGPNSGALPGPASPDTGVGGGRRARVRTAPPATVPAPTTTPGRPRRRSWWPLTLLGMLVAIAGGITLVFSIAQTDPDDLVASATEDLRSWNGVHYLGSIAALDGGEIEFDLTVTADGASGTLTRNGGQATAELLWDESGILLRANRQWWQYHHGARADELADTWVADPLTETQEIDPILALNPAALAQHVRPEQPASSWEVIEQQLVGGRTALLLSDGTRRLVVSNDNPNRLHALDLGPAGRGAPIQVSDVPADDAGAVGGRAAAVRSAESPKTLTQRLRERPLVEIKLEPEKLCVTETCGVTVTVTNSGAVPARGRLEISADGKVVATHPMDVHPGQVATFTAAAPNPHFANPGATGEILWESRAVDG